MVTLTVTPASEPVSLEIVNPAAFSAMLTVSSPAMTSRFSARAPAAATVTVNVAVAWFQSAVPAAVAVITQAPTSTGVSAPVDASTVHTAAGAAAYDSVVCTPPGAVSVGAVEPNVTVLEL